MTVDGDCDGMSVVGDTVGLTGEYDGAGVGLIVTSRYETASA